MPGQSLGWRTWVGVMGTLKWFGLALMWGVKNLGIHRMHRTNDAVRSLSSMRIRTTKKHGASDIQSVRRHQYFNVCLRPDCLCPLGNCSVTRVRDTVSRSSWDNGRLENAQKEFNKSGRGESHRPFFAECQLSQDCKSCHHWNLGLWQWWPCCHVKVAGKR